MPSIPLPGSERTAYRGARPVNAPSADERFEVTIVVRHNPSQEAAAAREVGRRAAASGTHLTPNEFDASHAAAQEDLRKVIDFAQSHGLAVVRTSSRRRSVIVSGTVAQFQQAFGVSLMIYDYGDGTYRGREEPIHISQELDGVVIAVLGLDNRPQARTSLRRLAPLPSYTPAQVMRLYNFPMSATGAGQCIALIELGGGYRSEDLLTYFGELGLPVPQVTAVSVDGTVNLPAGDPNSADGEVMLDIEIAGVAAPAARIAVYFTPNTDRGFLDAITKAIHDAQLSPSVISVSWGGPESSWTPQALAAFDAAFQDAAVLGITVCCAAGVPRLVVLSAALQSSGTTTPTPKRSAVVYLSRANPQEISARPQTPAWHDGNGPPAARRWVGLTAVARPRSSVLRRRDRQRKALR